MAGCEGIHMWLTKLIWYVGVIWFVFHILQLLPIVVRDDPKSLDDGGEISKSQGRGW